LPSRTACASAFIASLASLANRDGRLTEARLARPLSGGVLVDGRRSEAADDLRSRGVKRDMASVTTECVEPAELERVSGPMPLPLPRPSTGVMRSEPKGSEAEGERSRGVTAGEG
jgi:hypothetical protein